LPATIFPGAIFPRAIFPGPIFPGPTFPGTIFRAGAFAAFAGVPFVAFASFAGAAFTAVLDFADGDFAGDDLAGDDLAAGAFAFAGFPAAARFVVALLAAGVPLVRAFVDAPPFAAEACARPAAWPLLLPEAPEMPVLAAFPDVFLAGPEAFVAMWSFRVSAGCARWSRSSFAAAGGRRGRRSGPRGAGV
jgi:hypothetical protein